MKIITTFRSNIRTDHHWSSHGVSEYVDDRPCVLQKAGAERPVYIVVQVFTTLSYTLSVHKHDETYNQVRYIHLSIHSSRQAFTLPDDEN